jgi:predicted acylesterase/phospholipase RssA
MASVNALCFGGGGIVGTGKAVGHLIGLDQVIRDRDSRRDLTKSFFDYMVEAGVPLSKLEARFEDVVDRMPPEVRSGQRDHISRYFKLCCGISGGSFIATAVVSELPMVDLIREAVHFPFTYYFRPDIKEYLRGVKKLPNVPLNVLKIAMKELHFRLERGPNEGLLLPVLRRLSRFTFELASATQEILPRGIFSGEGIEEFIVKLSRQYGLRNSFQDVRARGRHLLIIAERFNTAARLSDPASANTAVYFGAPPHDTMPVSHAIRASCSIPGITTPVEYSDPERGGTRFLLVDGAIGKTIGRRRLFHDHDIGVAITVNPIVPYIGQLNNFVDCIEQLYRKLIYSRLKAVEGHIEEEIGNRTIHIESNPDEFFFNMLRLDKIKEGIFEGYFQTLKFCAENYLSIKEKLALGDLCMIPREEIFALLNNNSLTRERARLLRRQVLEQQNVGVQLGNVLGDLM